MHIRRTTQHLAAFQPVHQFLAIKRDALSLKSKGLKRKKTTVPADEEEFPKHPQSPHGHQETSDSHAFAETHNYARLG